MMLRLTTLVAAALLLVGCAESRSDSADDYLLVSAAVSLSGPLEIVAGEFEQMFGTRVELNFAGSNTLATQLIAGVEADVFLSADERQMTRVETAGLVEASTRTDLFSNQLVVVVPTDRMGVVSNVSDLSTSRVGRIAIGDPDAVPAGVYARRYLQFAGVWESVRSKVVLTRDVRAVLAAVETGNVDAGFVYRTDLALVDRATMVFAVPTVGRPEIRYPGAVLTLARGRPAARRFLDFLGEPVTRRIFETAGFIALARGTDHAR